MVGEEKQHLDKLRCLFPKMTLYNFSCTSPKTIDYNCIAWAYGINSEWFQPGWNWPIPCQQGNTIDAYVQLFSSIGYISCKDASLEEGFEKIALYTDTENGELKHAARQLATGKWTSKLGEYIDIEHDNTGVLEGPSYGHATIFMKRKIN
jgi:hypothetical protein